MSQQQELDPSLVRFLEKNQPRVRKNQLEEFKEQIFFLKDEGFSDNQIVDFLRIEKNIKTTQQAVNKFIHSRKAVRKPTIRQPEKSSSDKKTVFKIDDIPLSELI